MAPSMIRSMSFGRKTLGRQALSERDLSTRLWAHSSAGDMSFGQIVFGQKTLNSVIMKMAIECTGNTKRGSITVPLTSCLTGLD
jgi:hypothetical protein